MIVPRTDCFDIDSGDLTLGMQKVMTAFIFLLTAFGIAILILGLECVFRSFKKDHREHLKNIKQIGLNSPYTPNRNETMIKSGPLFGDRAQPEETTETELASTIKSYDC